MGQLFQSSYGLSESVAALILADEKSNLWVATFSTAGSALTAQVQPATKVPCEARKRDTANLANEQLDRSRRFWDQMNTDRKAMEEELRKLQKQGQATN